MPPFLTGLLKRKPDTKYTNTDSSKTFSDNQRVESDESDVLLPGELNLDGDDTDDTDSEQEHDSPAEADQELDVVSSEREATQWRDGAASDESSDLEDSEADDDSGDEDSSSEGEESSGDGALGAPRARRGVSAESSGAAAASVDALAEALQSAAAPQPVAQRDEYSSGDTSDEEDRRNTVGDVPMWWYDEYPHAGYDLDGRRLLKPPARDRVDEFLRRCSDADFWRTVRDPATGQDVVLSAADLALLARLRAGAAPGRDEPEPWLEWFSRTPLAAPLRAFPDHKRSFLPSRDEQRRVARLVHALRMGWLQTRKQLARERARRKERRFYDLWGSAAADAAPRGARPIPAPRRALPAHAESYNPPPEYLLDAAEMKEWNALAETPWKRKHSFLPTAHASLRHVPAYERFARERFLRCLDLYLAPRAVKMRLTIRADDLVPRLPAPRDLRPFPTGEALAFRGHAGLVRAVDFDPSGQYAVSGGDDGTVRVWETASGRCLRTIEAGAPVAAVAWTPARGLSLVAAAAGARLLLLNPGAAVGAARAAQRTDELLREAPPARAAADARTAAAASWDAVAPADWARGVRLAVTHFRPVTHAAWHARGDYLCVTLRDAASRAVLVHQLSRRRSQLPFSRAKGLVQCAQFHPSKPLLFVATQRAVRVYDLVKQELTRKLLPGAQWVSCMAVHPGGDNLLVGSYDRKLAWFDLELSAEPYRSLRLHGGAVRAVAFHRRYPLFASAGDDRDVVVSHGAVFADLLQNPLLVPLKALRAGARREGLVALALAWHPAQPWLLLAGADGVLRLYA